MEFKPTLTKPVRSRQSGFTLVEILVAVGLGGMLLAVCMALTLFTATSIASVVDYVELNARSRYAIDRMSQKLRETTVVKSFSTNAVSVDYHGKPLTYTYDANLKALVEDENGKVTTLLEDCDNLRFAYFKRNRLTNAFNQFPILTTTNEAKVIQVSWNCSRSQVGKNSGSGEMASAKIVIRAK